MPANAPPGMKREIFLGIPVWQNQSKELYMYDPDITAPLVKLGTVADGFQTGWRALLTPRLDDYRSKTAPRARATAPVKK